MENKPWFYFFSETTSRYRDDTFYCTSKLKFAYLLEQHYSIIKSEILQFIEQNDSSLVPYFNQQLFSGENKWKALSFYFWGVPMSQMAIKSCPKTIDVLSQIEHVISASISVIEANTEIRPHYGDTDAIYRCHLPIVVPEGLPYCGFRVAYEDRPWEEGKLMVFNDAAYHKAWNYTNKRRIILLIDIVRPEFSNQKLWICAMVRGNIFWQFISAKINFLNKKNVFSKMLILFFAIVIYFKLSLLNRKSAWL